MTDDRQLLRQFADQNSQEAFAEVVRRHAGWIFQASLRRTGERHDLAQDVVQHVFLALAKHARAVADHASPSGWLYTTTRYAANHVLRAESRRSKYETSAMALMEPDQPNADWSEIRPLLDQAMDRLSHRDRETILQRYFEGLSWAEIAATQGISEEGVRKRLDRALDKLRLRLGRQGIASTTVALSALLGTQAGATAPTAVYTLAANAAWSAAAAADPSLGLGLLHLMSTTKTVSLGASLIAIVALLSSITFAVHEGRAARAAETAVALMQRRIAADENRVRQIESKESVEPDTPAATTLNGSAFTTRSSEPAANIGPSNAAARSDGRAFLQLPGTRAMLTDQFRAQIARTYALFYRIAGLSPAQIEAFESHLVGQYLDTLEVTPTGINPGQPDLSPSDVASLLGPEGVTAWQTFQRERVADYFAKNVALSVGRGADPLTADQMVQLVTIVSQNSPEFRGGGSIDPATVDWNTALPQAEKTMSPAQWNAAQPWLGKTYVDAQLRTLADTAR